MTQAKAYFDSEGFITSDVTYNGTNYRLNVGVQEFDTKLSFMIKPGSTSYFYKGMYVDETINYYGGGSTSFKFTNTTYNLLISYFYTDNVLGIAMIPMEDQTNFGFGYKPYFLCKSNNGGEYVREGGNGADRLLKCDTKTFISYSVQNNAYGIDTAILSKVLVADGHLNGVYIISLSQKGQPLSDSAYSGGIIIYLKGYGKFLGLYRNTRTLWAIKLSDETTETVTTTPTDESQTI